MRRNEQPSSAQVDAMSEHFTREFGAGSEKVINLPLCALQSLACDSRATEESSGEHAGSARPPGQTKKKTSMFSDPHVT